MKKLIQGLSVLTLALVLCVGMVLPASAASKGKSAIESIEIAGERNVPGDPAPMEQGWAGAAIRVGEKDITVTAVGRMYFKGANISHAFLIVNEDGSLVRDTPITVQGYEDSKDGTFEYYYFEKSEYITLSAGKTYYLCSDFYGPQDKFYDSSTVTTRPEVSFIGKVSLNGDGSWAYTDASGIDNLPVDIMYYVEGEEEPETDPGKTQTPESPDEGDKPADSQNTKPDIPKNNNEDKDNASDQAESASSQIQPWIIVVIVVLAVVVAAVVVIILVRKRGSKEKNNKE